MSYVSKSEQPSLRKRLQRAYDRPEHKEALAALTQLHHELEERNQSAAASLEEGFEETLTLHRLGVYGVLGRSLKTTNCLESVNDNYLQLRRSIFWRTTGTGAPHRCKVSRLLKPGGFV